MLHSTHNLYLLGLYAGLLRVGAAELRINANSIGQDHCPLADFLDETGKEIQFIKDTDIDLLLYILDLEKEYRKLRLYRFSILPDQSFELRKAERIRGIIEMLKKIRRGDIACCHLDRKEPTGIASLRDTVTGAKFIFD